MPEPLGAELDRGRLDRLATYLADLGESVVGPLTSTPLTGGRSNLTDRVSDGTSAWCLRRPPAGGVLESAHDVPREYRVVAALQDTAVPVARAVGCDAEGRVLGVPSAVMAFVDGSTVRSRDDLAGWTKADFDGCADGLVAALVQLHEVAPDDVGLDGHGRPGGYAERQLRRWSTQWERMEADDPRADRLAAALARRVPEQVTTTVVHGDYRVDNVLLSPTDPGAVVAIVDWELSTLGDPAADLALMCAYRHPALDGVLGLPAAWADGRFPSPEGLRDRYEARAARRVNDFGLHLALAYYKLAVIAAGIAYRHRLAVTSDKVADGVAATVPVLMEAGLDAMGRDG